MSDEDIYFNDNGKKLYLQYSNNDTEKLNNSIKELEKNFPHIFSGIEDNNKKLNYLLEKCFLEGYNNTCYFTNASHTYINKKGEAKESRKLYLRPKKTIFLEENISDDLTLSFRGYVSIGFFVINEIVVIGNYEGCKEFETEINITPYHTNIPRGRRDEYLNELIDSTKNKSIAEHLNRNLEDWSKYLDWRKELVKIRLVGIKYFNFYFDEDKQYIIFHLAAPSKNDFDKIRRYFIRRENIKVFDNEYSSNKWIFKFNEKSGKNRDAIPLGRYIRIIKEMNYNPSKEEIEKLNNLKQKNKKEGIEGFDFCIPEDIKENIESISDNPYLIEMAFEIEESILDELKNNIKDDILDKKVVKAYVEEKVLNKFKNDGFLALSAVGDFVLIGRLQLAIARLRKDESYCPNLPLWLFNIKMAEIPNIDDIKIDKWLNNDIKNNNEQKMAVIKMLAAKDVCLIQGPPGTGKTTVIAEAIYQFVLRGERVLIASQTNLAVDNALERLAKEPIIRAIRLNAQKSIEDIEHMTEDKVLNYFFKNIADKLDSNYLNKWENNERTINNLDKALRDINQYIERINQYKNKLNTLKEKKEKLYNDINTFNEKINRIKNNDLNRIKNQITLFNKFIKDKCDIDIIILPKDYINLILNDINKFMYSLENIKLDTLNINIDMPDDILTKGLKNIYRNINHFYEMRKDIESSEDSAISPQLKLLDAEISNIIDKMKYDNISDEDYDSFKTKLKKLKQDKDKLKTNSFELKEIYKVILDESIISEYNNTKNTNIIKNYINKNISKIDEIKKVFDNIEEYSNTYKDSLKKEEDTKELENQLKTAEGEIRTINEEENNLIKSLNEDNKKISNIKKENNISDETHNDEIYNILLSKREEISKSIEEDKDFRNNFENLINKFKYKLNNTDIKYENAFFKDKYINSCNVVGISCTENTRILEEKGFNYFDVVIIDEVSKATPAELLIPMLKSKKVILVGDHRQLPPLFGEYEKSYKEIIDTIEDIEENKEIRNILTEENFNKFEKMVTSSIFKEYFEKAPKEIKHSLLTQFRMHSDIMNIINRFYEGRLELGIPKDKENILKNHKLEIKRIDNLPFILPNKHAYWIDSSSIKISENTYENIYESTYKNSTSYYNILEINIIIELLKKIANAYKKLNLEEKPTIGVISLYQLQVNKLRNILKEEKRKGSDFSSIYIDINTVDRFQGKEKEIVIVSLVRNPQTGKSKSKHITAFERVNVAFSRAQKALIIVGAKTLYEKLNVELPNMDREGKENKKVYKEIIADLIYKNCLFNSDCVISHEKARNILKEYNNKMDN